jgi:hypothetical protein
MATTDDGRRPEQTKAADDLRRSANGDGQGTTGSTLRRLSTVGSGLRPVRAGGLAPATKTTGGANAPR